MAEAPPPVPPPPGPQRPGEPPASGATQRLFVALPLPATIRESLARLAAPVAGVRWTPIDQLHLTLRFLGDVPSDQISALTDRLAKIRVAPFVLPLEGVGSFPPNRPARVLWVGVGSAHPRLFQLRQRLDDTLLAAGLLLDVRTFHPHVTLARATETATAAVTRWLHGHRDAGAPPFQADAFALYASELQPDGAVHTLIRSFPLAN